MCGMISARRVALEAQAAASATGARIPAASIDGFIEQLVEEYRRRDTFHLAIAPEGTRRKTDHWKSGFYRLALATGAPLGLGFIDYDTKRLGIGRWIALSGDRDADLDAIRSFYADKRGFNAHQGGEIRFRD